jgi:hypothetical protein
MELKGKYVIIWIPDDAAKLFLGMTGQRPVSRIGGHWAGS